MRPELRRDTALWHRNANRRRHRKTQTDEYIYMYEQITNQEATTRNGAPVSYNRTGRRTDADACSLRRTKGSRSEVLPEALRRSSKQREPPRNPAQERAMEQRKEKQREKRPESVRQHFVLSARSLLLPRHPPFIDQEGAGRH